MKRIVWYAFAVLFSVLLLSALPASGAETIYDSVIRLHVLASSDSEEDQALKLLVRDAILAEYSAQLSVAGDVESAEADVTRLCKEIEKTAAEVVAREGYSYTVTVSYGVEEYPTREYGDYRFPAGKYRSLRVVIGTGEGQNWWCVLYPPLCLELATESIPEDDALTVGLTSGEYGIISGNTDDRAYCIRFKTLEVLEGIFTRR